MSGNHRKYIDEYHNVHIRDKFLGQGGQGTVYRTMDPDLAIKLATDDGGNTKTDSEIIRENSFRLKNLRLLPVPKNANISFPAALLRDHAGYVMQLLSEMVPLSDFWLDGKTSEDISSGDIPEWLSEIPEDPEDDAKKFVHYYRTGGLRRRLAVLYKCAALLARLHGRAMVYCDISPLNIFVSEDPEHSDVWLIDADNIQFETKAGGRVVFTEGYGAPELVRGTDGGRPASDCHAFAVVSFYLLSLVHPFKGRMVDGTDVDWADDENDAEEIEEKAYEGRFPYIDDPEDDSNSTDSGLPRQLVLTDKLDALFRGTFCAGKTAPWLRPTIYHWPEALAQASDITVLCPECRMTYYCDFEDSDPGERKCPYCQAAMPESVVLESYRWQGGANLLQPPCWRFVREIGENSPIQLPRRLFAEFTMTESDTPELEISKNNDSLLLKKSEHGTMEMSAAAYGCRDSGFKRLFSQMKVARGQTDFRFWLYADSNEPRLILCSVAGGGI